MTVEQLSKTYTQELEEENKYLKAEFEANKDKVFTQEDLDAAIEAAYLRAIKNYGLAQVGIKHGTDSNHG